MAPDYPEICKDLGKEDGPTHVVTSITRGLTAALEFKKKVESDSDVSKIAASLKINLELSSALTIEGEGSVNLTENETKIFEVVQRGVGSVSERIEHGDQEENYGSGGDEV